MTTPSPKESVSFRDTPVDILRGLAITIMVGANLIPYFLLPPAPFWLRLVSSVAAPLFIFISGMMVALSCRAKNYTFPYFLIRGGFVILIAAVLDLVVRGSVPFIDTDVLYLIGISLPLAYLFLSFNLRVRLGIIVAILAATPVLQGIAGYDLLPLMVPILPLLHGGAVPGIFAILYQWFINGWFPIFPWLAVALLGAQAGMYRWQEKKIISFARPKLVVLAGSIVALGIVIWSLSPGMALTRFGYAELFYPPVPGFMIFITGVIFCLFIIADILPVYKRMFDPLKALGECSLAIYILHMVIIELFVQPLEIHVPLLFFFGGYLLLIAGMFLTAYLFRYIRKNFRSRSFVYRILIGG